MAESGKNVNDVKHSNRSLLLNLLYFGGAQSRKSLAHKSNLTAAAITTLISELIADGAVVETDKISVEGRLGRNEQLIDIYYESLFVVGINFGVETFEVNLVSLNSKILDTEEYSISLINNESFGKSIAGYINDIISKLAVKHKSVLGIGVTIRGIVDSEQGISIDSYGVLQSNINISAALNEYINLPVAVENNVRSMLISDIILRHAEPTQSTLLIKYGPGVGGALLVGQNIFRGSSCHAIELGHICIEADGEKCICGKKGCLETLISYDAILEKIGRIFSIEQTPFLYNICNGDKFKLTVQKTFSAYENEDTGVENIFKNVIKFFALSVSNYASLFDPEIVLLSSEVFSCKKFTDNFQKVILSFSGNHKPRYLIISNSKKLDKSGAASVAINNFLATGGQILKEKK